MANLISNDLREAYLRTIYCVFASAGELEIIVNTASSALDELLAEHTVASAAFITASNPSSRRLDAAANAMRNEALCVDVQSAGFSYLRGEGRDPAGEWQSEQSLLVLGIAAADATMLARRYEQNAYVFIQLNCPTMLIEVNQVQESGLHC
jgi:hypothetical protein